MSKAYAQISITDVTDRGIQSITELYYCSDSYEEPEAPAEHVTLSADNEYNKWNLTCPIPTDTYKYYYTCSEILYTDDTRSWSNVVTNNVYNTIQQIVEDSSDNYLTKTITEYTVDKGVSWSSTMPELTPDMELGYRYTHIWSAGDPTYDPASGYYEANMINGLTAFLSTENGQTVIDGGNIKTGTVVADSFRAGGSAKNEVDEAAMTATQFIEANSQGVKVGNATYTNNYVTINEHGLKVYEEINNTATDVASFGTTARVGQSGKNRFEMGTDSLTAYDSNGNGYFTVSASGLSYGGNAVATKSYAEGQADDAEKNAISESTGIKDTRSTNETPAWYIANYPRKTVEEFKECSVIGLDNSKYGMYCTLSTLVPWRDRSGGYPKQTAKTNDGNNEFVRVGTSDTDWGAWRDATVNKYITAIDDNGIKVHSRANTSNYASINSNGMQIYKNVNGTSTEVASFGETARIGKSNSTRFEINSGSLSARDSNNNEYFSVSSSGLKWGTNTAATTSQVTTAEANATFIVLGRRNYTHQQFVDYVGTKNDTWSRDGNTVSIAVGNTVVVYNDESDTGEVWALYGTATVASSGTTNVTMNNDRYVKISSPTVIDGNKIVTGTINADKINGGTLSVGGNNISGGISIKDGNSNTIGAIGSNGMITYTGYYGSGNSAIGELPADASDDVTIDNGTDTGESDGSFDTNSNMRLIYGSSDRRVAIGNNNNTNKDIYSYLGAKSSFNVYSGTSSLLRFASYYSTKYSGVRFRITCLSAKGNTGATKASRTSGGVAVRVGTTGILYRYSGSSKRYKHDITTDISPENDPHRLYNLPFVQFKYNEGHLTDEDQRYMKDIPGFIAEDVEKYYPMGAELDDEGIPCDWNEKYLLPPMLKLIQEQHEEIELLKSRVEALEQAIVINN